MAESALDTGQWLAAARAGSPEALGNALQACRNYLLLVAAKELDSDLHAKGGASDLVQETFLDAQRDFARFQGTSEAELLAWLRKILVNKVANFTRHYRTGKRKAAREVPLDGADSAQVDAAVPLVDPLATPGTQAVEREEAAALERALERLPEDYRQVLVLRYREGRSFAEIGPLMNRSPEAARKLWTRAMDRLQEEYEGRHEGES